MNRFFTIVLLGFGSISSVMIADDLTSCIKTNCAGSLTDEASYTSCLTSCEQSYSSQQLGSQSTAVASTAVLTPPDPSKVVEAVESRTYDPATGKTTIVLGQVGSAQIKAEMDRTLDSNKAELDGVNDAISALQNNLATIQAGTGTAAASGSVTLFGKTLSAVGSGSQKAFQDESAVAAGDTQTAINSATTIQTNIAKACNAVQLLEGAKQTSDCVKP